MCIVLFFVGAPLGALIRKGGIGLPMVIAILIFLTYHFISIFAKNSSEDNSLDPVFATWLGGLIMLPFSVYLTSRATKDRALIDLDAILIPMKKKLVKPLLLIDQKKVNNNIDFDNKIQQIDNSKLFELIKNYRFYGLSETKGKLALNELESRGIDCSAIEVSGKIINEKYNSGLRHIKDYHENSTLALYGHIMFLIFGIFGTILKNNNFEILGYMSIFISVLSLLLFLILFPKTLNNQSDFYDLLDKKFMKNNAIFIILSIPLFILYRIYFNKKMKEDLMKIN